MVDVRATAEGRAYKNGSTNMVATVKRFELFVEDRTIDSLKTLCQAIGCVCAADFGQESLSVGSTTNLFIIPEYFTNELLQNSSLSYLWPSAL